MDFQATNRRPSLDKGMTNILGGVSKHRNASMHFPRLLLAQTWGSTTYLHTPKAKCQHAFAFEHANTWDMCKYYVLLLKQKKVETPLQKKSNLSTPSLCVF